MLAAGNFPAHRTLCEFRQRHLDDFGAVFAEVVRLARGMGLAGLGRVSVDGTKVRANASKRKAMSYGRMVRKERRLRVEIAELLEKAEAVDAEEDERHGEDIRGDELPEEQKRREEAARRRRSRLPIEGRRRTRFHHVARNLRPARYPRDAARNAKRVSFVGGGGFPP